MERMIEHLNIIGALNEQICALLDLMMMTEKSIDIASIKSASEMVLNMQDELMEEVYEIEKDWREENEKKEIRSV